jgi:hypothetical protein
MNFPFVPKCCPREVQRKFSTERANLKYDCSTSHPFDADRRERQMVRRSEFSGALHITNFSIPDLGR